MDRNTKMGDSYNTFISTIFPVNKCTRYAKSHPQFLLLGTLRPLVWVAGAVSGSSSIDENGPYCAPLQLGVLPEHMKCVWCS